MSEAPSLEELLALAAGSRGPADALREAQSGADALALALHCLMVRDGYVALDRAGKPLRGYHPPPDWNAVENLWAFDYSRPGAVRRFRLQVALQPQTRRVFIHASETDPSGAPAPDNTQVMGLQLDNYVRRAPHSSSSGASSTNTSWQGVILSEPTLEGMWAEFVAAPLWRHADKASPGAAGGWLAGWRERCASLAAAAMGHDQQRVVLPAAAVLAAAAAAALLLYRHQAQG